MGTWSRFLFDHASPNNGGKEERLRETGAKERGRRNLDLCRSETGQGVVEYGLIVAFVAIVVIVGLSLFGGSTNMLVFGVIDKLSPGS